MEPSSKNQRYSHDVVAKSLVSFVASRNEEKKKNPKITTTAHIRIRLRRWNMLHLYV